jgi:hypothetical protein
VLLCDVHYLLTLMFACSVLDKGCKHVCSLFVALTFVQMYRAIPSVCPTEWRLNTAWTMEYANTEFKRQMWGANKVTWPVYECMLFKTPTILDPGLSTIEKFTIATRKQQRSAKEAAAEQKRKDKEAEGAKTHLGHFKSMKNRPGPRWWSVGTSVRFCQDWRCSIFSKNFSWR